MSPPSTCSSCGPYSGLAAPADPQLGRGQASDQDLAQRLRVEATQMAADLVRKLVAQPGAADRAADRLVPGRLVFQHVLQHFGDVEHLDAVAAQRACQRIVFLLGPPDPGQRVKEQPVPTPRGNSFELQSRAVQQHRPQPADLAVRTPRVAHYVPRQSLPRLARQPLCQRSITISRRITHVG